VTRDTQCVKKQYMCLYAVVATTFVVLLVVFGPACARRRPTAVGIETAAGLARLHVAEGRYDTAIVIYRELLAKTDGAPFVRIGLAAALFEKGDLAAAEAQYRKILEEEASSPVALYNLGATLARQGRLEEADLFARQFVSLHGEALPVLASKAESMVRPASPSQTNALRSSLDLTPGT
jgi:tetratricopeptide (TPR) repeat protein